MTSDITRSLCKSVGAIHHVAVDKQLSLVAKKLFNVLLYLAHGRLLENERHEVRLGEVCALVGYGSRNMELLKDALRALVATRVEWNVLGDAGGEEWGVTSALAEAKIANGRCVYAYSPTLREKLANPQVYALINLQVERRFTSTHAWTLYENLVRYRGVGRTPVFPLETLVRLLGLADTKAYRSFKYLKRDVLTPAMAEINDKGDVEVALLPPLRDKRRIVALQFIIAERQHPSALDESLLAVRTRLKRFGVVGREAGQALERHGEERLSGLLDQVEERHRQGKVRKLREYTLTVLREAQGDPVAPIERERTAASERRCQEAAEEELRQEQERSRARELHRRQEERLREVERGLSEQEAQTLQDDFVEHLEAEEPFVYREYLAKRLKSRLVRDRLHEFKVRRLLPACDGGGESREPDVGSSAPAPPLQ